MAKRLAQLYTSLIFVDPLAGCLLAWLLMPGGSSGAVQLAVANALVEVGVCVDYAWTKLGVFLNNMIVTATSPCPR